MVGTVALSFGAWYSVYRATHISSASDWIIPGVWFALLLGFLGTMILSVRNRVIIFATLGACLGSSFLIAFPFFLHGAIILFGWALSVRGVKRIWEDIDSRLHFQAIRSLAVGFSGIAFSFVLVLSSLYFSQIRNFSYDQIMPKLDVNKEIGSVIRNTIIAMYPDMKKLSDEHVTVDEFLLSFEQPTFSGVLNVGPEDVMSKNALQLKQQALFMTRKQFSDAVGISLSGSERVDAVFLEAINRKIYSMLSVYQAHTSSSVLAFITSAVLFFTVISLTSLFKWVWYFVSYVLFNIFVRLRCIRVVKMVKEADIVVFDQDSNGSSQSEPSLKPGIPF